MSLEFLNYTGDVLGLERMEIKNVLKRENDRLVKGRISLRHDFYARRR
jgi:hypothetical protein